MKKRKCKLLFVFGTRPEALKLAPLILKARSDSGFAAAVCLTAQHREMVDQVLKIFRIKPDFDLNVMKKNQTLSGLTQMIFPKIQKVITRTRPDVLIVQGDTTTAFVVALAAFYERVPVAHIEAGLRSFNKYHPFPEEINRKLISHLADFHFVPTRKAGKNLLVEGIAKNRIFRTGNTIVDALALVRGSVTKNPPASLKFLLRPGPKKIIFVTAHRRESFGKPLAGICRALARIAAANSEVEIVYPVHLNPYVQRTVYKELRGKPRIHLLSPLSYVECLWLMEHATLILTDSGGIQEEAPSFHKPVLVMREVTERPEGVRLGIAKLVGTSGEIIFREVKRLLENPKAYAKMIKPHNPYGDGNASERILKILKAQFS